MKSLRYNTFARHMILLSEIMLAAPSNDNLYLSASFISLVNRPKRCKRCLILLWSGLPRIFNGCISVLSFTLPSLRNLRQIVSTCRCENLQRMNFPMINPLKVLHIRRAEFFIYYSYFMAKSL